MGNLRLDLMRLSLERLDQELENALDNEDAARKNVRSILKEQEALEDEIKLAEENENGKRT